MANLTRDIATFSLLCNCEPHEWEDSCKTTSSNVISNELKNIELLHEICVIVKMFDKKEKDGKQLKDVYRVFMRSICLLCIVRL